jgi:hypothetical protein
MKPLKYTLDKDWTEGLLSVVDAAQKEEISVPYEGTLTGRFTISFKNGLISLSADEVIKKTHVERKSTPKSVAARAPQMSLNDRWLLLKKEFGEKAFFKKDVQRVFKTNPDYISQLMTKMVEEGKARRLKRTHKKGLHGAASFQLV